MSAWWEGVARDFSDLPDVGQVLRVGVRLVMAGLLGGLLGLERQRTGKAAGLRTHMLVALGAALLVVGPQQAGFADADTSRVIQGLVAGIGFLGAGAILKMSDEHRVLGLTTAASVWMAAAVGVTAGMGWEVTAILGTLLAFLVLSTLREVEAMVPHSGKNAKGSH